MADPKNSYLDMDSLLTPRQLDVLKLMKRGMPTKLIARELGLSSYTVKEHRAAIFQRLAVGNVVELVNKVNALEFQHTRQPTADAESAMSASPRILLVEDDALYRKIVSSSLQLAGFHCTSVSCSTELYQALNREIPDIVLLDLNLAGEDGLDIARELRTRFSFGVIIITTRAMVDQRIAGLAVGADAYMVKPLSMRELVVVITNLHQRRTQWRHDSAPD